MIKVIDFFVVDHIFIAALSNDILSFCFACTFRIVTHSFVSVHKEETVQVDFRLRLTWRQSHTMLLLSWEKTISYMETFRIMIAWSLDLIHPLNPPSKPLFHHMHTHTHRVEDCWWMLTFTETEPSLMCCALLLYYKELDCSPPNICNQMDTSAARTWIFCARWLAVCFLYFCVAACEMIVETDSNGSSYYTAWLPINIW